MAPGLPRSLHLFIAQQNLFCCGSEAEPERGLEPRGNTRVACGGFWGMLVPLSPQMSPQQVLKPPAASSLSLGEAEGSPQALKMMGLGFWGVPE